MKNLYVALQARIQPKRVEYARLAPQIEELRRKTRHATRHLEGIEMQPPGEERRLGEEHLTADLIQRRRRTEQERLRSSAQAQVAAHRAELLELETRRDAIAAEVRSQVATAETQALRILRRAAHRTSVFLKGNLRSHPFPRELSRHLHQYDIHEPLWLNQSVDSWLTPTSAQEEHK